MVTTTTNLVAHLSATGQHAFAQGMHVAGKSLKGVARAAGLAGAATGALAATGFVAAVKSGADFEQQMANVQSRLMTTRANMSLLTNQALELGAKTQFSAGQAAGGMDQLAAAGFSTRQILQTLPGTLALAAASGTDLAFAAELQGAAIRGFGLRASAASHVADVLAMTVNKSALEMSDLGETLPYVASTARQTGTSFEQVAAAAGILGNAGIKGSMAGTALRTSMLRLTDPTEKMVGVLGKLGIGANELAAQSLPKVIGSIAGGLSRLPTRGQKVGAISAIFGKEAAPSVLNLMSKGQAGIDRFTKSLENSKGAAKRAADIMRNTVKGSWDNFTGSVETASIKLTRRFQPALKRALNSAAGGVNKLTAELPQLGKRLGVLFRGDKLEPKRTRSPGAARRADSEPVATRSPGAARRADSAPSRERELSGLESFAKRAGHIFRVVRQFTRETFPPLRDAVKEAGRTLVDSFRPALPFLQHVLLPLAVGVGKGVVGALVVGFRLLVPVLRVAAGAIKVVATVLGWVGDRARPLRGWIDKFGAALGAVSQGPMLLMGVAARAGAGALKFFAGAVRGVGGVAGKVLGKLASFVAFVKSIPSKIAGVGVKIVEGIANGIKGAPGALLDALKSVVSSALDALPGGIGKAAGKVLGIDGMAKGGRARYTGPHVVGEKGIEVVNLNRGDHVTPNARLGAAPRALAGGAAFLTVPIVVELEGRAVGRGMGRIALNDLARA